MSLNTTSNHNQKKKDAVNSSSSSYKICLSLEAQRHIVELSTTTTLQDVYDMAQQHFGVKTTTTTTTTKTTTRKNNNKTKKTKTTLNTKIELKAGFPPKPLSNHTNTKTTLAQSILGRNERVLVSLITNDNNNNTHGTSGGGNTTTKKTKTSQKKNNNDDDDVNDSNAGRRRRPAQRSAAKVATDNFKDVIRAQDALLQNEGSSSKRKRTSPTRSKKSKSTSTTAAAAAARAEAAATRRRFAQLSGGGHRLGGDGGDTNVGAVPKEVGSYSAAAAAAPPSRLPGSPRKSYKRPRSSQPKITSKEDVATTLMDALSSTSSGGGKVGSILRSAMKNAVSQAYETSRANARVAAVQGRTFQINHNSDDESLWNVSFPKGVEGRGRFEETVDVIPLEALVAVIRGIYHSEEEGKESLRPPMLAQVSPRVFWSVVQVATATTPHRKEDGTGSTTPNNNHNNDDITCMEDCLQRVLPDLDWSYLKSRTKTLSEKAKENLRQQQVDDDDDNNNNSPNNMEAAEQAVKDVEHAMEQLHQYDSKRRRDRVAGAALARFHATSGIVKKEEDDTKWILHTPEEHDAEELQECIVQSSSSTASTPMIGKEQITSLVTTLMEHCHIYNWRQLANANATDIVNILNTIHHQDEEKDNNHHQGGGEKIMVSVKMVESWLDYAQSQSVEEVIVEICDGRLDAVETLRDQARSGTPKDLCHWRHIPEMLWEECGFHNPNPSSSSTPKTTRKEGTTTTDSSSSTLVEDTGEVSLDTLATWCQRAYQILEEQDEYEWLNWYTTSVGS